MEFQVPKFIERQPRIIWTITFRQFIFLICVAGALGLLYLMVPSKPLFYLVAFLSGIFSFTLVFVKIGGRPFSKVLWNFMLYFMGPKLYLWERKAAPPRLLKKTKIPEIKREKVPPTPSLRIAEKSRLKEMARKIETGV